MTLSPPILGAIVAAVAIVPFLLLAAVTADVLMFGVGLPLSLFAGGVAWMLAARRAKAT